MGTGARIPPISSPGNENYHRLIFSSVVSRTPTTDDDDYDDENNDHSRSSLPSSSLPSPLPLHSCIFFLCIQRVSLLRESSFYQECTQTNKQTRELKKTQACQKT